jgi:hypothetical protein
VQFATNPAIAAAGADAAAHDAAGGVFRPWQLIFVQVPEAYAGAGVGGVVAGSLNLLIIVVKVTDPLA